MRVGRQRFSVRRERLERRDKGEILKSKKTAAPLEVRQPFEAQGKPDAIAVRIVNYISDSVKSTHNNN